MAGHMGNEPDDRQEADRRAHRPERNLLLVKGARCPGARNALLMVRKAK
jgi:ribosomal protein L3